MRHFIELQRMNSDSIERDEKVAFDVTPLHSNGIIYDSANREVVLPETGLYSVKWWVATETAITGCLQFAISSDEFVAMGATPIKRGEVTGFGAINATQKNVRLSLKNVGSCLVMLPQQLDTPTASLLVMRIPEDNAAQFYNRDLSSSGSFCNVEIGNVVYQITRTGAAIRLVLFPQDAGKPVYVDVKRSSHYDDGGGMQGRSFNDRLLDSTLDLDTDILLSSNEMHRTWIRQLNPEGTLCSLCEVDLFVSKGGSRTSIWVNWIYRDVPTSEFV